MAEEAKRHSESVLSDRRDRWWNDDFLQLIAKRLSLHEHERVLDVGCGQGHWGQRLLPLFAADARLEGVDQESSWTELATARAERLGVGGRCSYRVGRADDLPYPDGSFTLVTCQTLLMHLRDPEVGLREMLRVLNPGGRLLLAEPSNVASQFSADTVQRALSPAEIADIAHLLIACSRGRAKLGRGDDCMADTLPSLLDRLHVQSIVGFQNDRASLLRPPYDEGEVAELEEQLSYVSRKFWLWDKDDARLLFDNGAGDTRRFEDLYASFLRQTEIFAQQVRDQTYTHHGASFHFLITGVKKE